MIFGRLSMKKINTILFRLSLMLLAAIFLNACATSPEFDTAGLDASITPQTAVGEMSTLRGEPVLWGGVVITSTNLKDSTQVEILAYPLNSNQRPNREQKPLGRFLAVQKGYLETTDYAPGRLITVRGNLADKRAGRVGDAEYTYPVVNITQLYLWSDSPESQVQFGFGLMIHN
jgi:outer membrane lipoprotein